MDSKKIISEMLYNMADQSFANTLRAILFDEDTKIDWENAKYIIKKHMPEVKI
ncbi:UNVERIFIED_CONTAM: hypothetical protein MUK63_06565 [Blautia caecimuris]